MSNNEENPNTLSDDEAFIDALYKSLPEDSTPDALDQRILAAAHREVSARPKLVKKRPAWLKPMASAAAVLLVITVSIHQIYDPGIPVDALTPSVSNLDEKNISSKTVSNNITAQKKLDNEERTFETKPLDKNLPKMKSEMAQLAKRARVSAKAKPLPKTVSKESLVSGSTNRPDSEPINAELADTVLPPDSTAPSSSSAVMSEFGAMGISEKEKSGRGLDEVMSMETVGVISNSAVPEAKEVLSEPINSQETIHQMTKEIYIELLSNEVSWKMTKVEKNYYLIEVLIPGGSAFYKLDRKLFVINVEAIRQGLLSGKHYSINKIKLYPAE